MHDTLSQLQIASMTDSIKGSSYLFMPQCSVGVTQPCVSGACINWARHCSPAAWRVFPGVSDVVLLANMASISENMALPELHTV